MGLSPSVSRWEATLRGIGLECAMTEQSGNVWVQIADEEIIVTLLSSTYKATFYKPPPDSLYLSLKDLSSEHDPRAPLTRAEFLGQAWEAAKEKARELGWIS
jgi:hypothetical protein